MSNVRERELLRRRDELLRETVDLTSNVVQSLEQQQQFAHETQENLHNQNLLLSLANEKMRAMNEDLTSVVNEINEIDEQQGCFCFSRTKKKKKKNNSSKRLIDSKPTVQAKPVETSEHISLIPKLLENNEQERIIVNELNQMKSQLLVFQGQVKTINRKFEEGDEIIHQLGNESNQYMHAIDTALTKAEQVLGRKFVVNEEQPTNRRKQEEIQTTNT